MQGLRAPHSLYVRTEKRGNQAVLEMRGLNEADFVGGAASRSVAERRRNRVTLLVSGAGTLSSSASWYVGLRSRGRQVLGSMGDGMIDGGRDDRQHRARLEIWRKSRARENARGTKTRVTVAKLA